MGGGTHCAVCHRHLGLLRDDSCLAAGKGLQRAAQLTVLNAAIGLYVLKGQRIRIIEQHQDHCLRHQVVNRSSTPFLAT